MDETTGKRGGMRVGVAAVLLAALLGPAGCGGGGGSGDAGGDGAVEGGPGDAGGDGSREGGAVEAGTDGGMDGAVSPPIPPPVGEVPRGPGGTTGLGAEDCAAPEVRCVNDDDVPPGTQEYATIQAAVDEAAPGDTVLVFDGEYEGFRIETSGRPEARITVSAQGTGARITSPPSGQQISVLVCNASYVTVEGFVVPRGGAEGFGVAARCATAEAPMRGVVIRNNVVTDSGSVNLYVSQVADSVVEGNVTSGSRESHGIYVSNAGSDDTVIRYNVSFGNAKAGIHFNGDASIGGDGVQSGLWVEGNVLFENGSNGLNMDGVRDSTVVNNVVFRNRRHALRAYRIDASAGPRNMRVLYNTFVGNGGWGLKFTEDDGGHVIFGNVMLGNAGHVAVDTTDVQAGHNVVGEGDGFSLDGEDSTMSLAEWQATGRGEGTVVSDPVSEFVDPDGDDYHLRDGAAALGSGVASFGGVEAPARDAEGRERPAGSAIDRGAYERE